MSQQNRFIPRLFPPLILSFLFVTLFFWVESPTVAHAQGGSISGAVYQDVAGTAITSTFTLFPTPARLSLFSSNNNGTLVMTTTTDSSGHFLFTGLTTGYYYITVDNTAALAGFSDGYGAGMVEQTYASSGNASVSYSGPICAGSGNTEYFQQTDSTVSRWTTNAQNKQKSGPCYGGRAAALVNDPGTVLNLKKHVIKVRLLTVGETVTGLVFAFSNHVVTNLEDEGAGSLQMFIRAANAITGANTMRFVPAVAPNMTSAANKWWRLPLTTTATLLPVVKGADTTLDGLAYYYRTGAVDNRNSGNIMNATAVGVNNYTITPIERPELEILRSLNANEATLNIQGDRVTIRRLAFTTDSNQPASYHIRQNIGTGLLVENTVMGYDMTSNSAATYRSHYGIETAYNETSVSSGVVRHNYIATNLTSVLLSSGDADPGNVVAATLGDWTIEQNILSDGIRLGAGTDRILIRHNKSDDAIIMAQSPTINTAVGNNTISENTLTSASGDIIRLYEADNNTVTLNVLQNGNGSGVSITAGGEGNRISQNAFGANAGNALDLGDDGVTTATNCTGAGGANGGLGRPTITNAQLVGQQLTITVTFCNSGIFDLEFYKATEGAGESLPPAGEGSTYLGTLSNVSGGAIANAVITVPGSAGLTIGDKITVLAIDATNSNTSEFSANYALLLSISGKLFQDVAGTADATGPAFVGATTADVHLYNIFGVHVGSTKLNAAGEFIFGNLTNDTYYVTLNDYRGLVTGDPADGTLLVEQTYGSAGNGATGSGPICISAAPAYNEQTSASPSSWVARAQNGNVAAGPCYGGRSRASSAVSSLPSPAAGASDHVIRVIVKDANVSGVAFGFSANVVTNLSTTTVQGSLPTFLKLANTLAGPNTMHFVPTLPPNQTSGANTWWRIALPGVLPQITDSETTVSGVAYSNVDGVTIRNTNSITLGVTGAVGLGADGRANSGDEPQLQGVAAPELELIPAGILDYGLDINANQVTIAQMALYGFGDTTTPLPSGANNYGESGNIIIRNGVAGATITHNILGASANSFADPGAGRTKGSNIIFDGGAGNVVIEHNLIGFAGDSGILKYSKNSGLLSDSRIAYNELRGNGKAPATNTQGAAIELNNAALPAAAQTVTIANNLLVDNAAQGIQLTYGRGMVIDDNSVTGNGANSATALDERQNIQLPGSRDITVRHNTITSSVASDGIELLAGPGASSTAATNVRITQNSFGSNRGQAINLVPDSVNLNNGLCNESGQQNLSVDYPVITLAEISSDALRLTGSTCAGVAGAIEVYKVAPDSGQGETHNSDIYGEGGIYLGSFVVNGGAFSQQTISGVTNLVAGEYITTLFIDNNGNTSEFSKNSYVYTPVTLTVTPAITEGQSGLMTATLSIISLNPVNVTLSYTNLTAASGDYSGQTTLTIPANTLSAGIPFNVVDDATVEDDETVQVMVTAVQNATNGATPQTITLLDNDVTSVTLAASPTLIEGTTGSITATLATTSVKNVNITLVYTNGATANSDYSAATTLVVPGGQRKASIPFSALSDNLVEVTETLQVGIFSVQHANNNSTPQPITILNDTDHDLLADGKDSDDDGDGIADLTEGNGTRDTDGDGIADSLDTDSDNDNIPDAIEGHDANGDGQPDRPFATQDADRDGLDDAFDSSLGGIAPTLPDSDLDATPNYLDRDDDNDGQNTDVEDTNSDGDNNPATMPTDGDGDRIPDYLDPDDATTDGSGGDSDGDGIYDSREYDANQDGLGPDNTDGDGRPDYLDNDDDQDGVPTRTENADPNGDGNPADAQDLDKDGTPDYRDNDDDNDGVLTQTEDANTDSDGNPATTPTDADGDLIPDYLDPDDNTVGQNGGDSDSDGLRDAFEYGANRDSDSDRRPDYLDNDDDNDGLLTSLENGDPDGNGNPTDALDSDQDQTPDYLDADSDNDGLFDGAEYDVNKDTFGPDDSDGDGKSDYRDSDDDNDGVPTAQEGADPNGNGDPSDAVNYDGDGLPNYLDNDDDNDGKNAIAEDTNADGDGNPATNPKDADGDTIPDYLDPDDATTNSGGGDSDDDGLNDAGEVNAGGVSGKSMPAMLGAAPHADNDGDGKPDYMDNDDDNDTLPTTQEGADPDSDGNATDARDTDHDGTPDYRDSDDDNDGKPTAGELASGDADGDRIVDYLDPDDTTTNGAGGDSDGDSIADAYEFDVNGDNGGADDSDGDKTPDYLDTDDDGDGAPTSAEKPDANGDGNPTDAWDTDADTIPDYLDTNNTDGLQSDHDSDGVMTGAEDVNSDGNIYNDDSDGDGTPNYLDSDDDNDGIPTKDEDTNGNGNPVDDDADKDGIPNYLDTDSIADFDNDGLPDNIDDDDDNDGVTDGAEGNGSVDTDGDGVADWHDTDDDNDGVATQSETVYGDTDGDGIPNYRDRDDDGDGIDTTAEDRNGDGTPVNDDSDQDSTPDYLDNDDDGDGVPTKLDNTGLDPADVNLADDDTDSDGTPNYLDNDDDGDNVPTNREDLNQDGDFSNDDTDGDGIANALDADDDGDNVPTKREDLNQDGDFSNDDTDSDSIANALDADDDGDGIPTKDEDANGNGDPTDDDTNGNGVPDYLEKIVQTSEYRVLMPIVRKS